MSVLADSERAARPDGAEAPRALDGKADRQAPLSEVDGSVNYDSEC
jgi:hypothetical protein